MAATLTFGLAARSDAQTVTPRMVQGAGTRSIPSLSYYVQFNNFYDGDYQDAVRGFTSEARGSIKNAQSRWIDSICYETMWGECCFQAGDLPGALEHYTAALTLFKNFSNWMARVQFPATLRPAGAGARKAVPWGVSSRPSQLATFPNSFNMGQGQIDVNNTVRQGGVVQMATLIPVTPQEIVRCTTLAMRRRALLLGPISKYDPLTNELLTAVNQPIGVPNHWSDCWVQLERGLAMAAAGQESQAVEAIQRSVLAAGEFDHPMTCIALLELGRHAMMRSDYEKALRFFEEASYAAVNFSTNGVADYGVLEEAFRYGTLAHLLANRKGFFPPLEAAAQWAKVKNLRQLRASLLLCMAENYAVLGETRESAAMLEEAKALLARRKTGGWLVSKLNYLSSLAFYQQRKIGEGNAALAACMESMRTGSLWLFQIAMVDELYVSGKITQRAAVDLFNEVLREPQPADWAVDPQETLAVLTTPHPGPIEHWFEATVQRKDNVRAVEIADAARRMRFFNSLDLGGRLESLRWVLESPADALPEPAKIQRQDLLVRYPAYDQLSRSARAIREKLASKPLAGDQAEAKETGRQLAELGNVSSQQEVVLREIALRREPVAMVFPPPCNVAGIQKALPDKHAVLAFFATSRNCYGFLLNNERLAVWEIGSTAALSKQIVAMLHSFGQFQQNHELTVKELGESGWKSQAGKVLDGLLKGSPADFSHPFDSLAVVPDGILWYVPFDALQTTVQGELVSLISRFQIRYVPTVSLSVSSGPGRNFAGNTAVVVGKLHSRDGEAAAKTAFEHLEEVMPGAKMVHAPLPAPSSLYRTLLQTLVVFEDLDVSEQNPYGWAPASVDRGKPGSTLGDWLSLPWGGPDVIILPGFHTASEDAMKRQTHAIPGNDVFLSACGLMANGARTILLSRWRMGGQTSYDLVQEFAQELPHGSPAAAWKRSVTLAVETRVNLDAEPRVKRTVADEAPKASHPFFWAGYMLIDCGTDAEGVDATGKAPALRVETPKKAEPAPAARPAASPEANNAPAEKASNGKAAKSRQTPTARKNAAKTPKKTPSKATKGAKGESSKDEPVSEEPMEEESSAKDAEAETSPSEKGEDGETAPEEK
jgi:tetratricopeptide (TPR) repeat protein